VLDFSTDDKTWANLAHLNSATVNVELPDGPLRAIRLRAQKAQRYRLIIREIVFSGGSWRCPRPSKGASGCSDGFRVG